MFTGILSTIIGEAGSSGDIAVTVHLYPRRRIGPTGLHKQSHVMSSLDTVYIYFF